LPKGFLRRKIISGQTLRPVRRRFDRYLGHQVDPLLDQVEQPLATFVAGSAFNPECGRGRNAESS
jgi:hypothetical protein